MPRRLSVLPPRTVVVGRVFADTLPMVDGLAWTKAKLELTRLVQVLFGLPLELVDSGAFNAVTTFHEAGLAPMRGTRALVSRLLPSPAERPSFLRAVHRALARQDPARIKQYVPARLRRACAKESIANGIVATYERRVKAVLKRPRGQLRRLLREGGELTSMKAWTTVAQHAGLDLVVTNVPVLYGHADGTALHALVRGGLIGGFAHEDGRRKRAGGTCVATSYPLVSGDPVVRVLGGERLSNADVPLGLAALMAHELGHLLLGLGDNYEHRRCLMHPPAGLDFHRWWVGTTPVRSCAWCNLSARLRELILRQQASASSRLPAAPRARVDQELALRLVSRARAACPPGS